MVEYAAIGQFAVSGKASLLVFESPKKARGQVLNTHVASAAFRT